MTALVPADCDLRDFAFMPLDVRRLLTSETWILGNGDERAAAMTLWLESWHQVPAGSLPNNDRMLAHLSQCPKWSKVREHALRGWEEGGDGRLYHRVVCEKALEAWIEKLSNSLSGASGNAKRWGVDVDLSGIREQFVTAVDMLRALAPQSKALKKKIVATILAGSPPDKAPESPPVSPPDRKGQGQGQGLEEEAYASVGETADVTSLPRCQAEAVVSLYHEVLPELPRVRLMGETRRKAIGKWWRWVLTSKKSDGQPRAQTADQALTWIRAYFGRARDNDFVMGRTKPSPGHEGWKCDLDFLMTERGMRQVIEKTAETA